MVAYYGKPLNSDPERLLKLAKGWNNVPKTPLDDLKFPVCEAGVASADLPE